MITHLAMGDRSEEGDEHGHSVPDAAAASPVIESPEALHAPHHTGIKWLDAVTTLSVLMVSLASLVISLHTGSAMDNLVHENARLVRASSTPLLNFGTANSADDGRARLTFTLSNSGTGPARIVWFQIRDKGVAQSTMHDLLVARGVPVGMINQQTQPLVRTIVRAGEDRVFFRWNKPASAKDPQMAAWRAADAARFGYQVEACYCSLLGECWQSTLNGDIPRPVPICTPSGHPSFGELPHG
jgi:hypothetical protein